ncbi:hypothetical protein HYV69_00765 [Candidatus Uhrbacteria bacterium]|nr:hypothetical protein [Candidatus Uhrbacteria bacterium]
MSDAFEMGQGLGHHLEMGFARHGWTKADVNKLGQGDLLANVLKVVRGTAVVKILKHVVDLAGDCMPESWKKQKWEIERHVGDGQLELDLSKIQLHLSPNQKDSKTIEGNDLRAELEDSKVPVLNACVLEYLLAHPEIIPEDWKVDEKGNTRYIYFWGTVYRNPDGVLYVRCLFWSDGAWSWGCAWLDNGWGGQGPAAMLASVT